MNHNHTNLMLMISIVVSLVSIAVFVFFFKVIENKNEHTSVVLVTLAEKIADKKNAETLISKLTELDGVIETINNSFVDQGKIDTFVDYLEKLGLDNGVELTVKNIEVSTKEEKTIIVKVSTSGNFNDTMRVLYLLENIPYHVSINQAFINKDIKTTETEEGEIEVKSLIWQADITFNILSL